MSDSDAESSSSYDTEYESDLNAVSDFSTESTPAKSPQEKPAADGAVVPIVTQSHTGLHDRPIEKSTHEMAKLSSLFSAFIKCLKWVFAYGDNRARGVCVYISNTLECQIVNFKATSDGRKILINLLINGEEFTLLNVYAPTNKSNREQFLNV